MQHTLPALTIFAVGCVLIYAGRTYARATTVLLSTTALMLSLTLGTVLCQRIGLSSGSAEAAFWPSSRQAAPQADQ